MVRIVPIFLSFTGLLVFVCADRPAASTQISVSKPTVVKQPTFIPRKNNVKSKVQGKAYGSNGPASVPDTSENVIDIEVETWSFCSEGWLVPLGWLGLCPDRYDFGHIDTIGTTRTVTSTRNPSQDNLRQVIVPQISASTIVVTESKQITRTRTETSTKIVNMCTPSTELERTHTITKTKIETSPVTVSVTRTRSFHVPITITHTAGDAMFPVDPTSVTTVTITSTATLTETVTQPTVTSIIYEDGPAPNNTSCFGQGFLPPIQRAGCENFYALHRAEQAMAWVGFIIHWCLMLAILELFATLLFRWLPTSSPKRYYQSPFAHPDDSDQSGPNSPRQRSKDSSSSTSSRTSLERDEMTPQNETKISKNSHDEIAHEIINVIHRYVVDNNICNAGDHQIGYWMYMLFNEQRDRYPTDVYDHTDNLMAAMYPRGDDSDIRRENTLPKNIPGAIQRKGPQDLIEIQEKCRQWADANHDATTAKEIRAFVDKYMDPTGYTDHFMWLNDVFDNLVGYKSGYDRDHVPTWRPHLEVALCARTQEIMNGEAWSPQFEGHEELLGDQANFDACHATFQPDTWKRVPIDLLGVTEPVIEPSSSYSALNKAELNFKEESNDLNTSNPTQNSDSNLATVTITPQVSPPEQQAQNIGPATQLPASVTQKSTLFNLSTTSKDNVAPTIAREKPPRQSASPLPTATTDG